MRHLVLAGIVVSMGLAGGGCEGDRAIGEERERPPALAPPIEQPKPQASPLGTLLEPPAQAPADTSSPPDAAKTGEARIEARSGAKVAGTAKLIEEKDGVRVIVELTKAPAGKHGLHIHEKGDCTDPKAESAGEHLRLPGQSHGLPMGGKHDGDDPKGGVHLGDLGNIEIATSGRGRLEHFIEGATLEAGRPTSLVARAVILHHMEDTGGDPAGHAGGRIGCGVIQLAQAGSTSPR